MGMPVYSLTENLLNLVGPALLTSRARRSDPRRRPFIELRQIPLPRSKQTVILRSLASVRDRVSHYEAVKLAKHQLCCRETPVSLNEHVPVHAVDS